jgi:hypothetical protein
MGGEYAQGRQRAVNNGFKIVDQETSENAAWGYRDCPFLFNAGAPMFQSPSNNNFADYSMSNFVRLCLDEPTSTRTIQLPEAVADPLSTPPRPLSMGIEFEEDLQTRQGNQPWSRAYSFSSKQHLWLPVLTGMIISTGNSHDLAGVPGLRSRLASFVCTGHTKSVGKAAQYLYAYANMTRERISCCPLNATKYLNI